MSNEMQVPPSRPGGGIVGKVAIVVAVIAAVAAAVYLRHSERGTLPPSEQTQQSVTIPVSSAEIPADEQITASSAGDPTKKPLPRLVDLGAGKCIPCKMMAPILEELKTTYAGKLDVVFVDVWERPEEADKYNINLIPTQIFYDASGTEQFRHEGFFSREDILAKWRELGVDLSPPASAPDPTFSRLDPATPDTRPKESVCYMCDADVDRKTRTVMKTGKGDVIFCSPHCYFITYSSMVEAKPSAESTTVTDWTTGSTVSATHAKYVYGTDANNRPTIKAFVDPSAAAVEQQASGGNTIECAALQEKELATRCGFCDRAVYPEDACAVKVEGLNTWGCCTMCALGVAARMQKDIEVTAQDALTGEAIQVKTAGGKVSVLEPKTAVAWAGTKKDVEGKLVSTGCFKQAFFVNEDNLKKWVEAHSTATGRAISINEALAEKMKLTPQQISKACKIGECVPK